MKIKLTVITAFGDQTILESDVHPLLTPDEMSMSMIHGATLSGMLIKNVEVVA